MKKILLTFVLSLFIIGGYAQTAANRTAKTKVADALALLPAPDQAEFNRIMEDLLTTGNEGLDMLTDMFTSVNNVPVNYALAGASAYLTQAGRDNERSVFAQGIVRALDKASDAEVKAFYIRLLQQCSKDEGVDALARYITDQRLGDPALSALARIKTAKAKAAISEAVKSAKADKKMLAQAVAQGEVYDVEPQLLEWLDGADDVLKKEIYFALGRTGTMASLPVLRKAASAVGYGDDPTHATRSYIALLNKFIADGFQTQVIKEAQTLLKSKNGTGARISGFKLLSAASKEAAKPVLVKAMDDINRDFRVGVLEISKPFADKALYSELLAKSAKVKCNEAKADILKFVAESGDTSFTPQILPLVGNADPALNIAAMRAVTALGGNGVPAILAGEMKKDGAPEEIVNAAKECLMSYKGRVNDDAAFVLESGNANAKTAALEVLAARRAEEKSKEVIAATASTDTQVSQAAFKALPSVVSGADLTALYGLLESTDMANVPMVQQAVAAALAGQTQDKQFDAVAKQMAKAGANKARYYVILAGTGAPQALEIIAKGYSEGNDAEKEQALAALMSWKGRDASYYLYDIAKDDKSDKALQGYVNLAINLDITPELKQIMLNDAMDIARTAGQRVMILERAGRLGIFQALVFAGKYLDDPDADVKLQAARSVSAIALAHKEYYGPVVKDMLEKAAKLITGQDSSYAIEAIRSHLAAMPQEGGYVSIFNGKDLTGWKGLVENPVARRKMTEKQLAEKQVKADEVMRRDWVVRDGLILFEGHGYDNLCSAKDYGDFEMYCDWLLFAEGTEADAGIYLRGTPQVQMWDTARRNVGAQVGSGGLYNNEVNRSTPLKVADNKLGHWNTFYIKMVADRVTVYLNGELVTDNVILENFWDRAQPIFAKDQIELQAHGTRVAYRNLYINELPMQQPYELSAEEQKEGYEILFDGTNMYKWTGNTDDYRSEGGAIVLHPSNGHGGNLYTKDEFGNFVFRFEFMLTPGANNGLGIRTPMEGDAAYTGMELQILDNDAPIYSELAPYQYHGSVYGVIPAKRGALKPLGEWNCQEVMADGDNIKITLNGEVIVDGNLREAAKNGTMDGLNHPGLFNKSGHIAFLGHGSEVQFKNIRIKRLK